MFTLRRATERGHAHHGWLESYHTFSFATYHDPQHMGFGALRVINEDRVAPGAGFGTHPHHDMEIVSYVLEGELEHKDSMGHSQVLRPGEFQHISAGTGIEHSEFNPSATQPVHFYQIWLQPQQRGIPPSYAQKTFPRSDRQQRWQLVASPDGSTGSLMIHQLARIYLADLSTGEELAYAIDDQRQIWLQVLRGDLQANGHQLGPSDALAVRHERNLTLRADRAAEVMLFDLA